MPDQQELLAHCQLLYATALEHHRAGRLTEAAATYRQAIEIKPDFMEALCNLGAVLHACAQTDAAIDCFRKAVELHPANDRLQYSLGAALQANQQHVAAEAAYRRALDINPDLLEAHFNLGLLLMDRGLLDEAAGCFRHIIENNPQCAEAHHNLGIVYNLLGNTRDACTALNRALELKPDYPEALNNLGNILMNRDDFHAATNAFRQALKLAPDNAKVNFNLGAALKESGNFEAALTCMETAFSLDAGFDKAFSEVFRIRQQLCAWESYDEDLARLLSMNKACLASGQQSPIYPFDALSLPLTAADQLEIAASHAREFSKQAAHISPIIKNQTMDTPDRLRIGYLSTKFNNHAGAHLIASLFGLHDRDRFEIFAYSTGPDDNSEYRQRIRAGCEHFINVQHESDTAIAQRIYNDGIHILVDLAVYNAHAATGILALRPAPAQVSYLGFPGTSGADFYDYILTDRVVTPPDQQTWYTEKFAYLPGCYQVNDHELVVTGPDPDRASYGLPRTGFVFCSFNNSYKIEPNIFDIWMRILSRVPDSVLWLLDHSPEASSNLRREAAQRGVAGERIIFAEKQPKDRHLARHQHAGLFLDTLYYNAHTTASDSLRIGVPVVTLPGSTFASRVGASLLEAVNLPEMITANKEQYEELAVNFATNASFAADICNKLATNLGTCPLFDTPRFARHLEQACETLWAEYLSTRQTTD